MSNHRLSDFDAERPLLIIGNGVHLARAEQDCRRLVRHMGIPVISSWTAADIVPSDHPLYLGRIGLFGDRAANKAVQMADFLLVIGCRLSIPQIGHRTDLFAKDAKIVMVDVDQAELDKPTLRIWHKVREDAGDFIRRALEVPADTDQCADWVATCQGLKQRYSVEPRHSRGADSFEFIKHLSEALPNDAIVVTDMGTSFTCTFQEAKTKLGQRWITASGQAPMGYGLPAAIGAAYQSGRRVICITGDGGMMMNLQEVAQIAGANLPITIFLLNNGGYLTMKHTQRNHFGRLVGADASSGLHMPHWGKLAYGFGLQCARIDASATLQDMKDALLLAPPVLIEIMMDPDQPLIPRVQTTKGADGVLRGGKLDEMYPYLGEAA